MTMPLAYWNTVRARLCNVQDAPSLSVDERIEKMDTLLGLI